MATYTTGGFSLARMVWQPFAVWLFIRLFHLVDRRPLVMRCLNACLRVKPVWVFGRTVLVTGDRQVRDVLSRDDDFPLPEDRAAKFLTGAFVLGMTRTPQFEVERAELQHVIKRKDSDRIRELSQRHSECAVAKVASRGQLDVVELSTAVGKALIREYFGVNEYPPGQTFEETPGKKADLADDLRVLGAMIASPDSAHDKFRQRAEKAAVRAFLHLDKELGAAERELTGQLDLPEPATVLRRLVFRQLTGQNGLDRDAVRRNMIGVLLPGAALVTRAFATSLVQLLKRKSLRRAAVSANGDLDLLQRYLIEALRFHPVFPVLPRYCPHDTVLPGFRRSCRIRAGKDVYVSVAGAMFDPHGPLFNGPAGGYPTEARVRNSHDYRHFGGGIHECLGQHIALPQMAAMLASLLKLPHLTCESIAYSDDGLSPSRLRVHFTPVPDRALSPDDAVLT
jgi:cytochrome P450